MSAGQGRDWDLKDVLIGAGVVVGLLFMLIALTGSDVDKESPQTMGTALTLLIFTILGSVGVALVRIQPRFTLLGMVTALLSLLSFGAIAVLIWSDSSPFSFGFNGTSWKAAGITALLSFATASTSALLMTQRAEEGGRVLLVRQTGIGALALFVGLMILAIVDSAVDIGARVYAIIAVIYVIATVLSILLRLLPADEGSIPPS
jgi:hypothetical protein